jgi:ABC-type Fe3+ transport system permease subunit
LVRFKLTAQLKQSYVHAGRKVIEQRKEETRRSVQEHHLFFVAIFFHMLFCWIIIYSFLYTNAKTRLLKGKRYSTKPLADLENSLGEKKKCSQLQISKAGDLMDQSSVLD